MEKKTITFKSGSKLDVTLEILKIINDRLASGNVAAINHIETFWDQDGKFICSVNINDISFIS